MFLFFFFWSKKQPLIDIMKTKMSKGYELSRGVKTKIGPKDKQDTFCNFFWGVVKKQFHYENILFHTQ